MLAVGHDLHGAACTGRRGGRNRLATRSVLRQGERMVHLSVAIGRFLEALFYAMARVAGLVTLAVIAVALAGGAMFGVARWAIRRR